MTEEEDRKKEEVEKQVEIDEKIKKEMGFRAIPPDEKKEEKSRWQTFVDEFREGFMNFPFKVN